MGLCLFKLHLTLRWHQGNIKERHNWDDKFKVFFHSQVKQHELKITILVQSHSQAYANSFRTEATSYHVFMSSASSPSIPQKITFLMYVEERIYSEPDSHLQSLPAIQKLKNTDNLLYQRCFSKPRQASWKRVSVLRVEVATDTYSPSSAWPSSHLQSNQLHKVGLVPKLSGLCSSSNIWVPHDSWPLPQTRDSKH